MREKRIKTEMLNMKNNFDLNLRKLIGKEFRS